MIHIHPGLRVLLPLLLASTASAQTDVRVATWNLQGIGPPGSVGYEAARAVLTRVGADVIGLNEVASSDDVGYLTALANEAGYPHVFVAARGGPFGAGRNAILASTWPLARAVIHDSATLSGDPAANDLTRDLLEVELALPAGTAPLVLFVQHWKSGTANEDEFRRAVESTRIAQAIDRLPAGRDAWVVVGDVNDELDIQPGFPAVFTSVPTALPASFVLGSDLAAIVASEGLANHPFSPVLDLGATALPALQLDGSDATRPASGRRLDYVMASTPLVASALAEVYDSADEALGGGLVKFGLPPAPTASLEASDHLLVFADLVVPATGCAGDAACDDGLWCNGAELCVAGACVAGSAPCAAACDEVADTCIAPPACDGDGVCEAGEDCDTCPADCPAGAGAMCGDSVCSVGAGESCLTCPADCNGVQDGKPNRRFCCGGGEGPVGCGDARCSEGGRTCEAGPAPAWCCGDGQCSAAEADGVCAVDCGVPACGDGTCGAGEDACGCAVDCGPAPATEAACGDGLDEDCDGLTDCDDADCAAACGATCDGDGLCEAGEDCLTCPGDCAGRTGGKQDQRYCCGDGIEQSAEGDGSVCDGNR